MKRTIAFVLSTTLCLCAYVRADDIVFTTLPQSVQTTVIRETHIASPTAVTHIVRDEGGVYAVTVHQDSGDRVVYVNDAGTVVQAPAGAGASTTTTTTVQQGGTTTTQAVEGTTVTTNEVQQDVSRYQLLEKKGNKEIYLDRQTGKKVTVKRQD
jgi:hypothetical protein